MALIESRVALTSADGTKTYLLGLKPGGSDQVCSLVVMDEDGTELATPIRPKITDGGKIAADFPGTDPNIIVQDENGQITNG